jgi:hypothetical protein
MPKTITSDTEFWLNYNWLPFDIEVAQLDGTVVYSARHTVSPDAPIIISPEPTPAQVAADAPAGSAPDVTLGSSVISVLPRENVATSSTFTSQLIRATNFTAQRSMTVTGIACWTAGTAAGATPSLIRYGLWSVDSNDDLTLVASTTHDATLLASTNTRYPKALTTAYAITKGSRYSVGLLVVTAATAPVVATVTPLVSTAFGGASPRMGWEKSGQADLPNTLTAANQTTTVAQPYFELSV